MKDNKLVNFLFKYKIAIILAIIFSVIAFFNPTDYKEQYTTKENEIKKINSETEQINNTLADMETENTKIEQDNKTLQNELNNKNEQIKQLEEKKQKIQEEKEKQAQVQADIQKQVEQKKQQSNSSNNSSTSNSNGTSNSSSSEPVANQSEPQGNYVYVNGGKSKSNKYHSSPNAHKMEGAIKMTRQQAEAQGYVACQKCY